MRRLTHNRCRRTWALLLLGALLWAGGGLGWLIHGGGRGAIIRWRMARVDAALVAANPDYITPTLWGWARWPCANYPCFSPISIDLNNAAVSDISALGGLSLVYLDLECSTVSDLSPLEGMPLRVLDLDCTFTNDLSALKGMPLEELELANTEVADLTPLRGMRLEKVCLYKTQVSDLTPLKGMPLRELNIHNTPVVAQPLPDWLLEMEKNGCVIKR